MQKKIILFTFLFLLIAMFANAGTTGKLAGRVTDETGNPIAYANVVIEGLGIGTSTDENGRYRIINIPVGTYNIIASLMGYQPQKVVGVKINLDETKVVNFKLKKTTIKIEAYKIVESKVEMVSKTRTSSSHTISSDTIEDLGVSDIQDLASLDAGITVVNGEMHARGGRANEVAFTVDGMSVSDPVDGGSALTVDQDAIEQTNIMTGGFPAEFGNAQSGMINIVTKSGSEDYHGKVEFDTDHLILDENSNSDITKFAIGGPVLSPMVSSLRKKFTFFFNAAANWRDSRLKDYYVSNPTKELKYLATDDYANYDPYKDRSKILNAFDKGERNFNSYNANIKFKLKPYKNQTITFAIRGDESISNPYYHSWKFALRHNTKSETSQRQYVFNYENPITAALVLSVKASLYKKSVTVSPKGVPKDSYFWIEKDPNDFVYGGQIASLIPNQDGVIDEGKYLEWEYVDESGENRPITEFVEPGTINGTYIDDSNKIYSFRSDLEYMVNDIHDVKTGVELIKHNIKKDRLFDPWRVYQDRYERYLKTNCEPIQTYAPGDTIWNDDHSNYVVIQDDTLRIYSLEDRYNATISASGTTDGYEANPWQGAYYIQDKMEWEGLVVNAGLRFDFWYLNKDYTIKTPKYEGSYLDLINPDSDYNRALGIYGEVTDSTSTPEYRTAKKYYDKMKDKFAKPRVLVSPRLGISHPISEKTVLHFAYNYQNQLPQMQYIFTTARPLDAITSDNAVVVGNPDLDPQITITYEVGLNKQLSENYVVDLTAYYKNIYNYVTTVQKKDENDENIKWYEYISNDYGSTRGIDINLQRMLSNFISGSMAYSVSWANGNNSDTVIETESTNLREFPLDWDIRNTFNARLTFKVQKDEEFILPFTDFAIPFDDYSLAFRFDYASGRPYTPTTKSGRRLDTNSARMKPTHTAGLRFQKRIQFKEQVYITAFVDIDNLFNHRNINYVYSATGKPFDDGADLADANTGYVDKHKEYIHKLATHNPYNVSGGRTLQMGITFHW